jgi:hypothetical protein
MKLSDQALNCVMVALQKSLMEQEDIVPMFRDFNLYEENGQLFVENPPQQMFLKDEGE